MATVVLQVVGAAIGGAIGGPVGATIGRAVGAAAGYAIDQQILSKDQVVKGGRLDNSRYLSSNEGMPIPKAYGRVRLGGQIIWATRFEERKKKSSSGGGKGGPSVTSVNFKYFANFAVGICEGEISHFSRIWADGKEIDQTRFSIRFYKGDEEQSPDPLIEALQGAGRTPAFKGTAYVVFEDFPLANYGNRIPQISFEVIRSIAAVDRQIRAVTIIPGATEFGYSPVEKKTSKKGRAVSENRHTLVTASDWQASLDELQALCPNLETVALVVSWFGTDLRAGNCRIEPRCSHNDLSRTSWQVNGISRQEANLVSFADGRPAFGGTPSDRSVFDAIADLKSRGLEVMFYPFVMMDIPPENGLPDPYGSAEQAAYPWRGRITCFPAPDQSATADMTASAGTQIADFAGAALPGDFPVAENHVGYSGPDEFSYRRMILHYAKLCELAGGVDRFLIGSEMPGLTRIRNEAGDFPFVNALVTLANDVKSITGPQTQISYAADWSEYFGYHPQNAANDVCFNLDPLWASPDIAAVAIDNYMPVSDWQDAGDPGINIVTSRHDLEYLKANIAGGEGKDWYYPDNAARRSGNRIPITDGFNEPWIWGYKALAQWWQNLHHERKDGIRSQAPTAWVPGSKPVWFTEIGCPAIDRGANQPNLFIDAKSSESDLPWFSRGGRDDLMQLRYLQAHLEFWAEQPNPANPVQASTGLQMLEPKDVFAWAWDARPYPAFPMQSDVWSDGVNWYRGHWINGRIGTAPLDALIGQIFLDHGLEEPAVNADGHLEGYVIAGETTPRAALEALLATHFLSVCERDGWLGVFGKDQSAKIVIHAEEMVQENDDARLMLATEDEGSLARQLTLSHGTIETGYDTINTASRRLETQSDRQISMEIPAVISRSKALSLSNARLRDGWNARHTAKFSLPQKYLKLDPADTLILENGDAFQVSMISHGMDRQIEATGISFFDEAGPWVEPLNSAPLAESAGVPLALLMNLPLAQDAMNPEPVLYCAATRYPWNQSLAVFASPGQSGFKQMATITEPSIIGELSEPLLPGPEGRWDNANTIVVAAISSDADFQSVDFDLIFGGANALAIEMPEGNWEIVQFQTAELIEPERWLLSGLLRGQLGSLNEPHDIAGVGARVVLLDETLMPINLPQNQVGLTLNWRMGSADQDFASEDYEQISLACNHVSVRPLSPVHLSADRAGNDFQLNWTRRSRVNSDSWDIPEVPLDYSSERYRVHVLDAQGVLICEFEPDETQQVYSDADRLADFGNLSTPFRVTVSQLDDTGSPGPSASLDINP